MLVVAIIADATMVLAYPSPTGTAISYELAKNSIKKTDWKTKDTWSTQTYQNIRTFTWLTDPCPNCKISAKPVDSAGDVYVAVVTSEGQTKQFTDPTSISSPNDYRLNIWRLDVTLLTTVHSSFWKMNA